MFGPPQPLPSGLKIYLDIDSRQGPGRLRHLRLENTVQTFDTARQAIEHSR